MAVTFGSTFALGRVFQHLGRFLGGFRLGLGLGGRMLGGRLLAFGHGGRSGRSLLGIAFVLLGQRLDLLGSFLGGITLGSRRGLCRRVGTSYE